MEYRQPTGFDSFLATNSNVVNGVVIHTGSESSPNLSYLLDMTPETAAWYDPALVLGQSFSDPDAGVTIAPVVVNGTSAAVSVTLGSTSGPTSCVRANPTVALSPSQSQSVQPGAAVSYTVSVTNNDSAACAASSFTLQASAPAGWTATTASPSLTVSPGTTASTTLQVTSSSLAVDRSYTVTMSATNSGASGYTGSGSATYVIASCVRANPSVTLSPSQSQSVQPGAAVTYTISVTNNDNAACGASSFALQATAPAGWTATLASPSLAVNPAATTSTTLQVTSSSSAADRPYTIGVTATNSADPNLTVSTSATYVVAIVSALTVTVRTDQLTYGQNDWVVITAAVSATGSPVSGASVTFTVTEPDGFVVSKTALTGTDGAASFRLHVKRQDPVGTYQVTATLNNAIPEGATTFLVQ